ncbi:hypothetical protein Poly24_32940 [Rosistilla carotiformis]|uniref:Secreted protein n=1 Tax=Rosistilla carotiformis TaxID=2528017 RepID=A0A518JVL8_9BACT|nr:hypothetical protein [Rosistilla carotiformis]QDV69578.1 hypothetical protein Poly24_32940 [Rosistilla carotiformis]
MIRTLLALLLIANLLACPLRCMDCHAASADTSQSPATGCACCHDSVATASPESSDTPAGGDCSCPNCLCEGATLQDAPEVPDAETALVAWLPAPSASILQPTPIGLRKHAIEHFDHSSHVWGRVARIAHQSWLI